MNPHPTNAEPVKIAAQKHSWRWPIVGVSLLGFLLVLAAVFISMHRHSVTNNAKIPVVNRTAQIDISADGFTPASLQIPVGTQVSWINNDDAEHQVAADPYPNDNSIPGFVSTVTLLKGQTYSFDFTKAGDYHYHDEKNPLQFKGTVTVQ